MQSSWSLNITMVTRGYYDWDIPLKQGRIFTNEEINGSQQVSIGIMDSYKPSIRKMKFNTP